jgi:hypothetical protein
MGQCLGSSQGDGNDYQVAEFASKKYDQDLRKQKEEDRKLVKILLLGTGESGKSTIFRQMQILYSGGFSDVERSAMKKTIARNIIDSISVISARAFGEFGFTPSQSELEAVEFVGKIEDVDKFSEWSELLKYVQFLWNESDAIKKSFQRRNEFYLLDSAE